MKGVREGWIDRWMGGSSEKFIDVWKDKGMDEKKEKRDLWRERERKTGMDGWRAMCSQGYVRPPILSSQIGSVVCECRTGLRKSGG